MPDSPSVGAVCNRARAREGLRKPRLPGSCCIYLKRLFFNMLSDFLEQRRSAHAEDFRRFAMIAGKFV